MEENTKNDEKKKMKNLISIIILLAGLFVGSLFIDVSQLIKGNGFSARNLSKSDIFEANGKTWVAYTEPAVNVTVVNDDSCEKCDVSDALVWLKRVLPTVSTQKVAYDSKDGKALIDKFGVKTLPAFIFDGNITKTEFYNQASVLFSQNDTSYVLKTQELGLPAGKYLALPSAEEGDATFGKEDSKVKVVVYSDYQCPFCKIFYQSLRTTMKNYQDKVQFVYKHLPLDIHPQAENAALASLCAQEQNKFWEYGDKLYANQNDWANAKDTSKFKQYAAMLGLKTADFNKCLDDKKYQNVINRDKKEGEDFGIAGTPAVFVNDQFTSGAMSADDLKKAIDDQLNK